MVVNPLKIFLFLAGGTVAAARRPTSPGCWIPYIYDQKAAAVAELPAPAPTDPAAPKGERLPGEEPLRDDGRPAAGRCRSDAARHHGARAACHHGGGRASCRRRRDTARDDGGAAAGRRAATPPAIDAPPAAGPVAPTFDVVRVEADGSVVIAGKVAVRGAGRAAQRRHRAGQHQGRRRGRFRDRARRAAEARRLPDHAARHAARRRRHASLETAVLSIPDTPGGQVLAMVEQPGEAERADHRAAAGSPRRNAACRAEVDEAAAPPADATAPKTDEAAAPPLTAAPQPPEVAAVTPPKAEEPAPAPAPAPAEVKVAVEAVEIEGSKIFVAGTSEPGRTIRAYANEILLGETRVSEGGRFLIEAERDLPVGNYHHPRRCARRRRHQGHRPRRRAVRTRARRSRLPPLRRLPTLPPNRRRPSRVPSRSSRHRRPSLPRRSPKRRCGCSRARRAGGRAGPACRGAPAVAAAEPPAAEPAAPAVEPAPGTETPPAVAAAEPPAADPQPGVAAPGRRRWSSTAAPAQLDARRRPLRLPQPNHLRPSPLLRLLNPRRAPRRRLRSSQLSRLPQASRCRPRRRPRPPRRSCRRCRAPSSSAAAIRCGAFHAASTVMAFAIRRSISPTRSRSSDPDRIWPGQVFRMPDKTKEGEAADMTAIGDQATTTPTDSRLSPRRRNVSARRDGSRNIAQAPHLRIHRSSSIDDER